MAFLEKKPIKRGKARIIFGQAFYITKKYIQWCFTDKKYTNTKDKNDYENIIFTHETPLYRKLKEVDMYLQKNKVENLKLALENLDGVVIMPGEYFSYWKLIGRPTYSKGYKDGMILTPEGGFTPGVGGGLCQLSNLLYWMTLHTPLTITERYRHSHDVFPDVKRTQPFGTGATCHYNYLDLEIKNNTNHPFQLRLKLTDKHLVGHWRSVEPLRYKYEVYEKEHSITAGLFGGYIRNNLIFRKTYNLDKEEIADEYITENHAFMVYQPYLEAPSSEVEFVV